MIIPLMPKSISFTFLYCVIGMFHILINLYHLLNTNSTNKELKLIISIFENIKIKEPIRKMSSKPSAELMTERKG